MTKTSSAILGYTTLQFHTGGFFDGEPTDRLSHLVVRTAAGTPGATLCGIDRFARTTEFDGYVVTAPGWSVGGGFSDIVDRCEPCAQARDLSLPVGGLNSVAFSASEQ